MNGLPYYKAYPRDFVEGTIGMPFEVKGAYRVVIDLIYMQGGELPDDARYISGHLGCSIRKWKTIREKLLEMGKLHVSGEFLTNKRADKELETLSKLQEKQAENASGPRKNKDLQKPQQHQPEPEPEPEPDIRRDTDVSLGLSAPEPASPIAEAVSIYNEAAGEAGWPKVQKMTPARSKALKARLKECGGIEGWRVAMDKGKASPFLCGQNDRNWRADFDFLTKSNKFTSLMEGKYDKPDSTNNGSGASGSRSGMVDAFAAVAARRSAGKG